MTIGQNIRRLRREVVGLTQRELAERVGVSPSAVTHWERGSVAPRTDRLGQIAEALGVDERDLVGDVATREEPVDAIVPLILSADGADVTVASSVELPESVALAHRNARAILVRDDAMDRVLPVGMVAVFDPDMESANGRIVVVQRELDVIAIRRWYRGTNTTLLVADSYAHHDDIVVRDGEPCQVLGVVVWVQSRELLA